EADGQSWYRIDPTTDTDSPEDWALTPLEIRSTPGTQPVAVVFDAVIEESAFGPLLRWNEAGGSVTYRVQMSEDLQEWTDEALELTELEWPLPRPLPPQVFFRVWADAAN